MSETSHYREGFGWVCPEHHATFEPQEGDSGRCPWCGSVLER